MIPEQSGDRGVKFKEMDLLACDLSTFFRLVAPGLTTPSSRLFTTAPKY